MFVNGKRRWERLQFLDTAAHFTHLSTFVYGNTTTVVYCVYYSQPTQVSKSFLILMLYHLIDISMYIT